MPHIYHQALEIDGDEYNGDILSCKNRQPKKIYKYNIGIYNAYKNIN